jgi:hypothetical protein
MVMPQEQHKYLPQNCPSPYYPNYPYGYYNTTIIILDNSNPYYDSNMGYYPSIFGYYSGEPSYVYTPSVYVSFDPNGNLIFQDISSYVPYVFDPFGGSSSDSTPVLGDSSLSPALQNFAQGWASGNTILLDSYLPENGTISLASGDNYQYSMGNKAYQKLMSSSFQNIQTTDFRYQGLTRNQRGDIMANATQTYTSPDGTFHKANLKIVFSKDSSLKSGYKITGLSVGK